MSIDAAVAAVARDQHGLLTRRQALDAGMTDRQIAGRCRTGRWRAVFSGVYEINGSRPTFPQRALAACLTAPGSAVSSHFTAARLWNLPLVRVDQIEILTSGRNRVRQEGIRHHRSLTLGPDHVTRTDGVPVTTVARTLIDVGGLVPAVALGPIIDDAVRTRLVTLPDLRRCFRSVTSAGGRHSTAVMRVLLAERDTDTDGGVGGSQRELSVGRELVAAGLPSPVRQHAVHLGARIYVLDHAYPWCKVGFEFDGFAAHGTYGAFHGDRERIRRLTAAGWTILQITSKTSADELVRDARAVLERRSVGGDGHAGTTTVC